MILGQGSTEQSSEIVLLNTTNGNLDQIPEGVTGPPTSQHHVASDGWSLGDLETLIVKQPSCSPSKCARRLKRQLRYFFMSPVEKWRSARTFPFKLCLELFKIFIVTFQLMAYGYDRAAHRNFHDSNILALRQIFQPSYSNVTDCDYCLKIYTMKELHASLDYFAFAYYDIQNISVGNYFIDLDPETNRTKFLTAEITSLNFTSRYNEDGLVYEVDADKITELVTFVPGRNVSDNPQILDLSTFLYISVKFNIHAVAYHRVLQSNKPSCTTFHLQMTYDNSEQASAVTQQLLVDSTLEQPCKENIIYSGYSDTNPTWKCVICGIVIAASVGSLILCARSAIRAERLRRVTAVYFDKYLNRDFLWSEGGFDFVDLWLYLIIISDLLLFSGSICWIILLQQHQIDLYDEIAILLGTGTLLTWFSILRYLNYYKKLSLLLLTFKRAFPEVLRFSLCAIVIFGSYLLFGWIVLGPHTVKFQTVWLTAEQLFTIMNCDDVQSTFRSVQYGDSVMIWFVSRIYLYSFISLYIYVVLSLFIAIIIDVYEDIKSRWKTKRFMPHCRSMRLLLYGNLRRLSDKERRQVAEKRKGVKPRRVANTQMAFFRRCLGKCFGTKARPEVNVNHVVSVDTAQYNLRSPSSANRPVSLIGGASPFPGLYLAASSSSTTEEDSFGEDNARPLSSFIETRQPPHSPTNELLPKHDADMHLTAFPNVLKRREPVK